MANKLNERLVRRLLLIVRAHHLNPDVRKTNILEILTHERGNNHGSSFWGSVVEPLN